MPFTWQSAIAYAQLVNIAFQVDPAAPYSPGVIDQIAQAGYTFIDSLHGNDLASDAHIPFALPVTYGFVARSAAGELVAAIRGTAHTGAAGIFEWAHDFSFGTVANPIRGGAGQTEDGFTSVYSSLTLGAGPGAPSAAAAMAGLYAAGAINPITIAGHSLGGALTSLLALDLALNGGIPRAPAAYTFASPSVGLAADFVPFYSHWVPESYRVFNRNDLVPYLPGGFYGSVGSDWPLSAPFGTISPDPVCQHILDTYLWLLGRQAGGNNLPLDNACRGLVYPGP